MDGRNARFVFTFFGLSRKLLVNRGESSESVESFLQLRGGAFESSLQVNGVKVSDKVFSDVLGAIYLN